MNLTTKLLTEGDPETVKLVKQLDEWHGAAEEIPDERGGRVKVRINTRTLRQEAFIGGKWVEIGGAGQRAESGEQRAGRKDAVPSNWVEWLSILSKPATYPPSAHLHDADYLRLDAANVVQGELELGGGPTSGTMFTLAEVAEPQVYLVTVMEATGVETVAICGFVQAHGDWAQAAVEMQFPHGALEITTDGLDVNLEAGMVLDPETWRWTCVRLG